MAVNAQNALVRKRFDAGVLTRDADLSAMLQAIDEASVSFGHDVAEGAAAR